MKNPASRAAARLRLLSAALGLPLALPVFAANAPAPSGAAANSSAAGEEIVTLSAFSVSGEGADRYRAVDAISAVRIRAPLIDTPSSITVITREMMDDLVPTRIFDVTRFVAGVQDGRGIQFQDRMVIRGFESQNGARTVDNFLQSADADNIEEAVIERIEIAKGPNAILSPAGAPGGSVNVITKAPPLKTRRSVTALLGMFDAQKVTLDVGGPFAPGSPFGYRVVAVAQDSRRYWSEDSRLRSKALAPMFSWRISKNTQFTFKIVAAEHWIFREPLLIIDPATNATTGDPRIAPGMSPKSRNGIQPWSHVGTHSADGFAQLTTAVNEHINLRFAGNGRYYFEDSHQDFLSTPSLTDRYNPYTGDLTQDHTWALAPGTTTYVPTFSPFFNPTAIPHRGDIQWSRRKTVNFQVDLAATYKFGPVSSQTVAGYAPSHQSSYTRGKTTPLPAINLTQPDAVYYPTYAAALNTFNTSSYTNAQLYLSERIGLLNDRLFLSGGIMRFNTRTTAANALTGAAPAVLDDGKTMSSIGILGKVRENISVYYSHSSNSSPVIANNLPLWRDGKQDELGVKTEWFNQRLSLNASFFEITQTNVTIPNPDRQTNPAAPQQLVADFDNHGYEVELMGSLTKELSVVATYSHLKMRDSLGRRVRAVADELAAVLINYRVNQGGLKGLSLNLGVNYTGRRAGDTPINYTPLNVVAKTSFFLKPMYSTTAGASYRWSERLATRLTIDNLLNDKDYIMVAGGRVSGTGITTAPGMNVKFSTTVNF